MSVNLFQPVKKLSKVIKITGVMLKPLKYNILIEQLNLKATFQARENKVFGSTSNVAIINCKLNSVVVVAAREGGGGALPYMGYRIYPSISRSRV